MAIRVLLVDDSAVIRGLMAKALANDTSIVVAGTAANGEMAIAMARELQPDIIVLDIEMPVMDGITALPQLLKVSPQTKIIMASTLTLRNAEISLKALELGATDYLPKPTAKFGNEVEIFYRDLIAKIRALAGHKATPAVDITEKTLPTIKAPSVPFAPPLEAKIPLHVTGVKALAIASSTGGPQALLKLFEDIKGKLQSIPIFITQHMPPTFTTILADHISKAGARECHEAKDGMAVKPGCAYLAPGDFHMLPVKSDSNVTVHIAQDPPENFCRPAADPMLRALSSIYGKHLAIVVLTGMGQDGMAGAKVAVQHGASVIAQNEASCVVYGMPRAVVEANICRAVLPLANIGKYLVEQIEGR